MWKLTILLFLGLPLFGYAQNSSIQIDSTLLWAEQHLLNKEDSSAVFRQLHKLKSSFKNQDDDLKLSQSYNLLSEFYNHYVHMDSALYYANSSKMLAEDFEDKRVLADIYLLLESIHKNRAEFDVSMTNNFKAISIFEQLNDQAGIARCYTRLCDLLYYENKYAEGADYCHKAITIQKASNSIEDLVTSYRYLADNELMLEEYDKALFTINKAIEKLKLNDNKPFDFLPFYNTRGNILKYMKRYDEALADYQYNYDVLVKEGKLTYTIPSLGNIGHVYTLQNKFKEALPYNLKAIELMKSTGNTQNLWENYMHVADCYKAIGDFEKALEYKELHAEEYGNFQESIITRLESEAQVKYETVKKDKTIVNQDAKIARQRKTQILYLTIAGLLLFSFLGMYFSAKNIRKKKTELQRLNVELDAKNKQNELLLKEIHHRVKNNLEMVKSLIALQSAQLDDKASKEAMLASQNRVQSMGIIHQKLYQGDNLGSIEMKDYFLNLSEGILDSFNKEEKVKIECAMENLELDIDTAVPIGLIVNELLTNALKYAFPEDNLGNIKISLARKDNNVLTLNVSDDGIGKTTGKAPQGTGFGTQLVQLLTQQLNGKMEEKINNGTTVSFQFKLNTAA